jgi:putative ABC transport system permease protein
MHDLRFALRQLAKSPGFTAVAVLTLALGIAGATVMFGVLKPLALDPLPYPEANRLVQLWATDIADTNEVGQMPFSVPDYLDLREQNRSFAEVGCYSMDSFTLGGDSPEKIAGATCTASLARVLGVQPALGRWFTEAEQKSGANRVVVLTHALWQRRFAADPKLLGQTIVLDGQNVTVLGVLPAGVNLYSSWIREGTFEVFRPLVLNREKSSRGGHWLATLGRLKPDVSAATARAELRTFGAQLAKAFPASNARVTFRLIPLARQVFGEAMTDAIIQQIAVALVLLLACANVAGMLLARAARRQSEIAVRTALGATRRHIFRLMLAESFVVSVLAGVMGVLLAVWGLDFFQQIAPTEMLARGPTRIDGPVALFAIGLALVTTLLAGLPPTLVAAKTDLLTVLKEGGTQQTGSPARLRHLRWLVVAQIALTLLLVNTALLLSVSYRKILADSTAFVTDRVLTAQVGLVGNAYRSANAKLAFRDRLLDDLRALLGVTAAGVTTKLPFEGGNNTNILVDDEVFDPNASRPDVEISTVSPGYFAATGLSLLRGQLPTDADARTSPQGVLVNRALVDRYWPGRDPLGKTLRGNGAQPWFTAQVVGVVENVRQWGAEHPALPEIYFPAATDASSSLLLVLRAEGDAHALVPAIRQHLHQLDPNLALAHPRTMREIVSERTRLRYFQTLLLDGFMAMALLLAAVGLYGTLAFYVAIRTREIGVRVALGATARDIARLVLRQAVRWLLTGAATGLALTLGVGAVLQSTFYETSPLNPLYLVASLFIVATAAAVACWLPARRAMRINPVEALRAE